VRHEGDIRIVLSRAELTAVREAVELTPHFAGRVEVRDTLRRAMRIRSGKLALEREVAERFVRRLVPVDLQTALAKTKLLRAIQDADRDALAADTAGDAARAA
jgi:hypothetical protein